ncbi:MAG: hypothetical protein M1383_03115 [Patescibacteria group bacterium]|nr:hypothetical protein [Patescibacteria group bacterium]
MREGEAQQPAPISPERRDGGNKMSRRKLLKYGGAAALGAGAEFLYNRLKQEEPGPEKLPSDQEAERLLKPPKFIFGESLSNEDEYVNRPEIFDLIDSAWEALESQEAGFKVQEKKVLLKPKGGKKGQKRKPQYKMVPSLHYNVLLAVTDTKLHPKEVEFVKVDEKGMPSTPGFQISKGMPLGVGTKYEVATPANHVVLAIKRALPIAGNYEEVIYTPYSENLDTPIIRKEGYDYLVKNLIAARNQLKEKGVKSKAFHDKLVADVMPMDVALKLCMIEHIDPFIFKRQAAELAKETNLGKGDAEREVMGDMANQALTVVGANREWSFVYAYSKAGAGGLFQFIPSTYQAVRERYPKAGLRKDFREGMDDHVNGAKASLLLFDSDLSFTNSDHRQFLLKNPQALGMYLASCYNGGAPRTVQAIMEHKGEWVNYVLTETQMYIDKFNALSAVFSE